MKIFEIEMVVLVVLGVDMNCIQEGIIPTQYYEKTGQKLFSTDRSKLEIGYKLQNIHVCQNKYCFRTQFILYKAWLNP